MEPRGAKASREMWSGMWFGTPQRIQLDHLAKHDLRRTCAKLRHVNGGEPEQIQFLLAMPRFSRPKCKQNRSPTDNEISLNKRPSERRSFPEVDERVIAKS
jgi:hypothetical protein